MKRRISRFQAGECQADKIDVYERLAPLLQGMKDEIDALNRCI